MIKNELPYSKEDYYVGAQGNPELNIDITANGDYDVRKYATAKVNVSGGGDFWSLALPDTGHKINAFSGTYEGTSLGHGEYGYVIVGELAPEEVWNARNGAFSEPFNITVNGNSYSIPYLDMFSGQLTYIDGIQISVGFDFPEEGEEIPYVIGLHLLDEATAEINCPDIHIAEPSTDAMEFVHMMTGN